MDFYGEANLKNNVWTISAVPDVLIEFKRCFPRCDQVRAGNARLANSDEVCWNLLWFAQRYPLKFSDPKKVKANARKHKNHIKNLQVLLKTESKMDFELALPPRPYQRMAAELFVSQGYLLLADQMGLGKTVTALAALSHRKLRPAVIVCEAHLVTQWVDRFFKKFLPSVKAEIARTMKPHPLDKDTEVLVISYSKLQGWVDHLSTRPPQTLIFDEVQQLRHPTSMKYSAARSLRAVSHRCLALSGSPIVNYGGEIYHIMNIVAPGRLGSENEFKREWCSSRGDKWIVNNPEALGSYLRREFLFLRRTLHDVGGQLPALNTIVHTIPYNPHILKDAETTSLELARLIMEGSFAEQGQASRELDLRLRQATGLAKAQHSAEFARMFLEDNTPIILVGWHRSVYQVWNDLLKEFKPVMLTGSETPAEKDEAKRKFISGETNLMIMSLRSGAGIDGLQDRCSTVIFGEIDWSRAIHEQVIFRVYREGQKDPIGAYYLLADGGSDPIVSQILGIKAEQADGIVDLFQKQTESGSNQSRIKALAQHLLETHKTPQNHTT